MTSPLLLSLTHHKLHAHTPDLNPASIPHSTPTAIAASPTYVAEGSQSGSLILRDPFSLQPIHTLPSHTSPVTALAISAAFLAAGHRDGTVSLHNLSSHDHNSFTESLPIVSLAYPSTARYLAAATASTIALFSTVSNRLITRLTQPATRSYPRIATAQARFTAVAFSPIHPSLLAATDDTGCLTVYDISTVLSSSRTHPVKTTTTSSASQSKFPSALKAPSTDLSFAPDGHLAVAGFDKLIRIFNPSLKKLLFTVTLPSPISSICYGPFVAVGLTNASVAIVRLNLKTASGTVVKRVSVDAGAGTGGSRAVKRVLFQPKPKRRKPPRSATPLNISSNEVNEEKLAEIDDMIGGKVDAKSPMLDDDIFSPVKERSPQTRELTEKSASFHASPTQREVDARRSRSVHSITTHGNPLEELHSQTTGEQKPLSTVNTKWDDIFDDDDVAPTKVFEDTFEGVTKEAGPDIANNTSDIQRRQRELPKTYQYAAVPNSSRSYTRTTSSLETRSHSKENWGGEKLIKSMSNVELASPQQRLKQKDTAEEGKGRTVRFGYPEDVMLGQPVVEMQRAKKSNDAPASTQEHAVESHEDFEVRGRTLGKVRMTESLQLTNDRDVTGAASASGLKDVSRASQPGVTADEIRDIIRQEIDVVRTDLRSDILNIHAELVTLATRQSQEIAAVLTERDHSIKRLEEEVRRLHSDNTRLRRKYGIG